jgi:hypothetical protein
LFIYIDRSKTTKEIKEFDDYIKSTLEKIMPAKAKFNIEHLDSEKNAALRAVDMFCYGIARKYKHSDDNRYNLIRDRIKKKIISRP